MLLTSLSKISRRCSFVMLFTKAARSCLSSGLITIMVKHFWDERVFASPTVPIIYSGQKTPEVFSSYARVRKGYLEALYPKCSNQKVPCFFNRDAHRRRVGAAGVTFNSYVTSFSLSEHRWNPSNVNEESSVTRILPDGTRAIPVRHSILSFSFCARD